MDSMLRLELCKGRGTGGGGGGGEFGFGLGSVVDLVGLRGTVRGKFPCPCRPELVGMPNVPDGLSTRGGADGEARPSGDDIAASPSPSLSFVFVLLREKEGGRMPVGLVASERVGLSKGAGGSARVGDVTRGGRGGGGWPALVGEEGKSSR
jgi:hypothetical protein